MKEGDKSDKKPRILLVADYSNFHATLARGLRRLGSDVTLVSDGAEFMKCERDIDISRRHNGKIGGLLHAGNLLATALTKMSGYDIVSFRDPAFLNLKPQRIRHFFRLLARRNGACFLTYLAKDVNYHDMLAGPDSPLRYNEWFVDGRPNRLLEQKPDLWKSWNAPAMRRLNETFYAGVRGTVTALYEYHLAALRAFPKEKVAYGGIPIDTDSIEHRVIDRPKKVRLFLARDRRRQLEKGSDLLETAARNVVARHPGEAEFVMLENVPRKEYLEVMRSCHVVLDQMYSYTPATMALESMASGLTVVSGAEEDYYRFIGETENFPIINSPIELEPLEKEIESLIMRPQDFAERSRRGREFVEKHNGMETVARRFLNFWEKNA